MSARSRAQPWFAMSPTLRDLSRRITTADMVEALWDFETKPLMQRRCGLGFLFAELPAAFGWRVDSEFWDRLEGPS